MILNHSPMSGDSDHAETVRRYLEDNSIVEGISDDNLRTVSQAFVTSGYAKEHGCPDNERLEFLGDALIKAYVSRRIYDMYPRMCEG